MLEVLKQMEHVTVINRSQLKTIKGAIDHYGEDDCATIPKTARPCSYV